MTLFNRIWSTLSISENQRNWFDYAESHLAHIAVGVISTGAASFTWLCLDGEFPSKAWMAVCIGFAWVLYEIITQGLQDIWGNIEDWIFLYIYGSLPVILLFSEIRPGDTRLIVDVSYLGPVYAIVFAHLLAGMSVRIWREIKND